MTHVQFRRQQSYRRSGRTGCSESRQILYANRIYQVLAWDDQLSLIGSRYLLLKFCLNHLWNFEAIGSSNIVLIDTEECMRYYITPKMDVIKVT